MSANYIVTDWDIAFGRKLNKVYTLLVEAGREGISKTDLAKRTSRMLSCARERDCIMADLHGRGMVVMRVTHDTDTWRKRHYWADKFAPPEDETVMGEWGKDQGW
jgi:20S proteasome alpha/beta subunit